MSVQSSSESASGLPASGHGGLLYYLFSNFTDSSHLGHCFSGSVLIHREHIKLQLQQALIGNR